jgi:hypothetical protein
VQGKIFPTCRENGRNSTPDCSHREDRVGRSGRRSLTGAREVRGRPRIGISLPGPRFSRSLRVFPNRLAEIGIILKKKDVTSACCCFADTVEISKPTPSMHSRTSIASVNKTQICLRNGLKRLNLNVPSGWRVWVCPLQDVRCSNSFRPPAQIRFVPNPLFTPAGTHDLS